MVKSNIEWRGLERLTATISNAHPKAVEQSVKVVRNNGERVKAGAKKLAAWDTGFMHDNITSSYQGMEAQIKSNAGYSGFVEYGTRKMKAQPFMRPALWDVEPQFKKDMTNVMKGAFK